MNPSTANLAVHGVQIISILLYHVLPQGAFTTSELVAAASVQSDLGAYLKANLPLTFASAAGAVRDVAPILAYVALDVPLVLQRLRTLRTSCQPAIYNSLLVCTPH